MNFERLNININGVKSPEFSGEKLLFEELASLVGSEIPSDYIQFISKADGGHPEIGCFNVVGDDNSENRFDVDWFYSVGNPYVDTVKDMLSSWASVLGAKKLPIGRDAGGNQFYLNLADETSSVWLYLHDEGGARLKLSNSFSEFLDGLIMNPDFI
ncbi:SMI1/KNR4 family protein [Shewanella algae]|uniref:SMI1/KNR4 family protein n=1 Tax=Shewanella algae TaxID=38313 RepID=UPI001AAF9547|nr:SMI1/KNR4 family protein [Shewanella algae]MBO2589624.1 SMI1/KNR4 family protein [Shewanella algae]